MRAILLSLVAASLGLAACSSSSGGDDAESQAVTVVFGRLTAAGGAPVAGARVRGGGASTGAVASAVARSACDRRR